MKSAARDIVDIFEIEQGPAHIEMYMTERGPKLVDIAARLSGNQHIIERMMGDEFGSWNYAREIEGWWIEGRRAHVRVLGVKHYMPMDNDPAENQFAHWNFALRLRNDEWKIHSYSEGGYLTAEGRGWVSRWRSGTIL